jgi:hypothetical protein
VFEEGMDMKQAQTVHRIRANSSIMQLKKLLGEFSSIRSALPPNCGETVRRRELQANLLFVQL